VEGLIGITTDKNEVFLVHINETCSPGNGNIPQIAGLQDGDVATSKSQKAQKRQHSESSPESAPPSKRKSPNQGSIPETGPLKIKLEDSDSEDLTRSEVNIDKADADRRVPPLHGGIALHMPNLQSTLGSSFIPEHGMGSSENVKSECQLSSESNEYQDEIMASKYQDEIMASSLTPESSKGGNGKESWSRGAQLAPEDSFTVGQLSTMAGTSSSWPGASPMTGLQQMSGSKGVNPMQQLTGQQAHLTLMTQRSCKPYCSPSPVEVTTIRRKSSNVRSVANHISSDRLYTDTRGKPMAHPNV